MITEGTNFAEWYCNETSTNHIIRKEHGFAAIIFFIRKNNIPPTYYNIYAIGMLIILTILFNGECTLEWAIKRTEYTHENLIGIINSLVSDIDVINILYLYDKAEELFNSVSLS